MATNTTVFALTVARSDASGHEIARVIAHFEFNNDGRIAATQAMAAIPNAGFEGPVGSDAYPIGREYRIS